MEYEFVHQIPAYTYDINVAEQVANDKAVSFEYGKGNGLYTVERGERLKDEYCNKLFAFGSITQSSGLILKSLGPIKSGISSPVTFDLTRLSTHRTPA